MDVDAMNYDPNRPLMAKVNEEIDRLHASLGLPDSQFFCECGHSACKERITLSRAAYASFVASSRPLLVAEHGGSRQVVVEELGGR